MHQHRKTALFPRVFSDGFVAFYLAKLALVVYAINVSLLAFLLRPLGYVADNIIPSLCLYLIAARHQLLIR
jgi:hypothetical protein